MFNVAVVGATGAVGGTMLRVLEERGFPVTELRPLASERSRGPHPGVPRPAADRPPPERRQLRGHRHRPLLGRQLPRPRVRARGRRGRGRGDRQLERLPDGRRGPPGGARGQRGGPRGALRRGREPQLRRRPPGRGPQAAGRRRRPGARDRLELPVGERHRPGGGARAARADRGPAGRRRARARGVPPPDRVQRAAAHRHVRRERLHRRGAQGRRRDAQDARAARTSP